MTKSFTKFLKNLQPKFGFVILGISLIALSSCKKTETDDTPYSAISVINASPTSATYDVYLGNTQLNTAALPSGGAVAYVQKAATTYDLKFTVAGRSESVFTKNVNLVQNTYQSFYLVGRPTALEGIYVSDDLSATSSTNAFVRFINLSPDAPALDLFVTGGASIVSNQSYKGISAFIPIAAGAYSFDVKDKLTAAIKTTLAGVNLVANKHYTIIVKGLITPVAGTEISLSAQLITQ